MLIYRELVQDLRRDYLKLLFIQIATSSLFFIHIATSSLSMLIGLPPPSFFNEEKCSTYDCFFFYQILISFHTQKRFFSPKCFFNFFPTNLTLFLKLSKKKVNRRFSRPPEKINKIKWVFLNEYFVQHENILLIQ